MAQDKIDTDPLVFLGLREREMLNKLAERDGRTDVEELKWLIRARASGHLKDLGDDRSDVRLRQNDLSQFVHVESLDLEPSAHGFDSGRSPDRGPGRPK